MADDGNKIVTIPQAQIVGCKTLKAAGGMRVELDCFENDEKSIAILAILANRKVVAEVTFRVIKEAGDEGKKKRRNPGDEIN